MHFDSIIVGSRFRIELIQDSIERLEIIAGENLVSHVGYNIENGCLSLKDNNKCYWQRSFDKREILIKIHFLELSYLELIGSCDIQSKDPINTSVLNFVNNASLGKINLNLQSDTIYFQAGASNCDYSLKGENHVLYLYALGVCSFDSKNLINNEVYAYFESQRDCYLHASNYLTAECAGMGNIYYSGNPTRLIVSESSTGRVIEYKK